VIFKTKNGKINIDVYFQNKTLCLTQKRIAELFEKGRSTITEHLKKIFTDNEYEKYRVIQDKNYISDFDREINKIIK